MSIVITQVLGRVPTFLELQSLAGQHDVHIAGNARSGEFYHPDPQQPKVKGSYTIAPNGDIQGLFSGNMLGKLTGSIVLATGKAEIIINEKPFLLPESILRSTITVALTDFCAKFPAAGTRP